MPRLIAIAIAIALSLSLLAFASHRPFEHGVGGRWQIVNPSGAEIHFELEREDGFKVELQSQATTVITPTKTRIDQMHHSVSIRVTGSKWINPFTYDREQDDASIIDFEGAVEIAARELESRYGLELAKR